AIFDNEITMPHIFLIYPNTFCIVATSIISKSMKIQPPLSFPYTSGFAPGQVYYRRGHIIPISPIDDRIYQILPFFIDQFGIGSIFQKLILIPDGSRYYGISQHLYQTSGYVIIGNPYPYGLFLFKFLGKVIVPRQNEGIWPWQGSF